VVLSDDYKLVDQLDPLGVPGLLECSSLKVTGKLAFAPGVVFKGDVEVTNTSESPQILTTGIYQNQSIAL
jgi:hypothetical protein